MLIKEMCSSLGQRIRINYGNTTNYCYQANELIKGFLFAILSINFPSIKSLKKMRAIPIFSLSGEGKI